MDEAWAAFRERAQAIPVQRLDARIGTDGWSLKQMLAHVWTWHDLTSDRLNAFASSGEPAELQDDPDAINARAARTAGGRTTGEILAGMEDSYRRLRREVGRLTDAQLAANDAWAATVLAGNTYDHYAEHLPDLAAGR
ncbi:MAG TPA: DinB family protein [Candidatus Limnocylindria bacterium]|nr:DinB family protein [Candidatus Limnocylindria bacterium]